MTPEVIQAIGQHIAGPIVYLVTMVGALVTLYLLMKD